MIKKILVSQPAPASEKSPYFEIEKKYNVEFTFRPFVRVEGLTAREFRQQKVQIPDYTAIVFTSRHAIDHFFALCKEMRITPPDDLKYFAISEQVSLYIQKYTQYRKRKVFWGATGKFADLVTVMAKHKNEKYLIPQSDVNSGEQSALLNTKKLTYQECVMYRTVSDLFPADQTFDYDMAVFFTSAGVKALVDSFENFQQGDLKIATFGKSAAQATEELGLRLDIAAPLPEAPSMTGAIELYLQNNKKKK